MQYKTFKIPCGECEMTEENLNAFLRSHKIISVQKEFYSAQGSWCFLVEYSEDSSGTKGNGKIDYMKILSQEEFSLFSKMRELRKQYSIQERIPAYAVFTDEQLSQIVKTKPDTIQKLEKINGIGQSKAQKYGNAFIKLIYPDDKETAQQENIF